MPKKRNLKKGKDAGETKQKNAIGVSKAKNTVTKNVSVHRKIAAGDARKKNTAIVTVKKKSTATKGDVSNKKPLPPVYQFKIMLQDSNPLIWRCIQVPKGFTFSKFHTSIIEAMGWTGTHHHRFTIYDPRKKSNVQISPSSSFDDLEQRSLDEEHERLLKYFPKKTNTLQYEYDFGDSWIHEILFEGEVPRKEGEYYPLFINGERACPPENCGGVQGYQHLCEIMENPNHPEHEEKKSWLNYMGIKKFNPDKFDPKSVILSRPGGYIWVQM